MALLLNSSNVPPSAGMPPNDLTLDSTVGALLLGTFFGLMAYGFAVHQSCRYFRVYVRDSWLLKAWISVIMLLETVHSILCMHMCYYYLVSRHASTEFLAGVWSANTLGIFTGAIIFLCQSFLGRSVHRMWQKYGLQVVVTAGVLSLGQFGMVTAATVLQYMWPPNQAKFTIRLLSCTHSGLAAAANVLLAAALVYTLNRSRTGFRRTDSMIRLLIMYTVNCGVLIGIFTILSFIFALVWPNREVYVAVDIIATKIYANTLLAKIISRKDIAHVVNDIENTTNIVTRHKVTSFNASKFTARPKEAHTRTSSPTQIIDIKITTETLEMRDGGGDSEDNVGQLGKSIRL